MMATMNFNVGVLGHIDSGKTTLAKALSTVTSTAAFDKNPQSRERGITLDLGFSSFSMPIPTRLTSSGFEKVQFTLVDCPGHASLIRTIIGGAQIIDMMMLIVDATKGMQTQTAECLVIGEITCSHLIIVLNKTDLFPESTRAAQIEKLRKKFARTVEQTRFSGAPIVSVSASPGGADSTAAPVGIDDLVKVLADNVFQPVRSPDGPFLFSVDHCFAIRGQGTVMTGTVLNGSVKVNELVEIPNLKVCKKIKSMQMFHESIQCASQGDRLGMCVTQFDPTLVERCLVSSPGYLHLSYAVVIKVFRIPYYKSECKSGGRYHVTTGHETVMAKTTFFASSVPGGYSENSVFTQEFEYQELLPETGPISSHVASGHMTTSVAQYALLEFEKPLICPANSKVIASRLDVDAFSNKCRIAFHGSLVERFTSKDYESSVLPRIRIFKLKRREGLVDRIQDDRLVIGKSLFKKETKIELFVSMKVDLSSGERGVIEGAFGTSGKFRVSIPDGLSPDTIQTCKKQPKSSSSSRPLQASSSSGPLQAVAIILTFKRYIFDPHKRMFQ